MPKKKENLYLTSQVDVLTGDEAKKDTDPKPTRRVGPGLLSEMDLTDEQVEKLPRGTVRPATADEIEAGQNRATAAETKRIAQEAERERRDAEVLRQNERQGAEQEAEKAKAEKLAEIDATHEVDRAAAAEKTTAELNEAQGIETATKSRRRTKADDE